MRSTMSASVKRFHKTMNMKKPLGSYSFFLAILIGLLGGVSLAADRPNIVWLVTEDNSASWYRLYNEHGAHMPNVERLAAHGLTFDHAFSCGPVCSVARSTIISGVHAPASGAQFHRAERAVQMPDGLKMFPFYLREAGYHTTNNSKTDYNFVNSAKNGVWDASSDKATFRDRKPGQPFFHVRNFGITHEGQLFGGLPKGEKPDVDPDSIKVFPYHPDTPLMRRKYAEYLKRQTLTDAEMGKVIKQLENDGLLEDTFIFHYGDHGGVLPGSKGYLYNDGLQVAMVVYVPEKWKHLAPAAPGSRIDGFVNFTDLSATVLNLAGVKIPERIDGKPFLGEGVELDELNQRDTALGYADRFDEKYDLVRSLHKGKFHYLRSYQPFNFDGMQNDYRYKQLAFREWRDLYEAGKLNAARSRFFEARPPEMLFDLEKDPHEINNLAGNEEYESVLKSMRGILQERLKDMPDSGFIPEPVLLAASNGDVYSYALENRDLIGNLIEIADLQLLPFSEAKAGITKALSSEEPLARYWGLIVCSTFGKEAEEFFEKAGQLATSDKFPLVRMRAAEFLGLAGETDPMPVLSEILVQVDDPIEANLVMNSITLLRDGKPSYEFTFPDVKSAGWMRERKAEAQSRMKYLQD